jgi:hypothetical protein
VTITQAGYHIKLPSPAERAFFVEQWICPGGLEVSTVNWYLQDLRFKTNPLH